MLGRFLDGQGMLIQNIFKLYPWEWLVAEEYGAHLSKMLTTMHWIEPAWKMLLSNKAMLAILWELFPNHPNLLPCYLDGPRDLKDFVKKPFLSREGANIEVYRDRTLRAVTGGHYDGPVVYQALQELPDFEGNRPVIGSWVVGNDAAGIGIRESNGLVTDNKSRFVPHIIR
jgi:glutathionylspermidine synthase